MRARFERLPPAPPQPATPCPPGVMEDFHHAQLPQATSRHATPTAACEPRPKRGLLAAVRAAHRFLLRRRERRRTKPQVVAVPCA